MADNIEGAEHAQVRCAVAWYRPEQWELLKKVSSDRDELEDTYGEWVECVQEHLEKMASIGIAVVKVDLDVHCWLAWCREKRLPLDSSSRSHYAAHLAATGPGRESAS